MKRLIPILLILALLLCGCQTGKDADITEAPTVSLQTEPTQLPQEETELPTEPAYPQYAQQTMFAVSMPIVQEDTLDSNAAVVFRHRYQTMLFTVQDPDVANSIVLDFLSRLEPAHSAAAEYSAAAQAKPAADSPYFYDVFYSPARIDQGVFSLSGTSSIYTDGQSGQTNISANYNMLTGEVLTLGSILKDQSAKEALVQLVVEQAAAVAQQMELFDDYADGIAERFDREESFDEDWYFTETGLAFYFSPYELAPYSTGTVTLEVPYRSLTGIIADEFFPPEEEILSGALKAHLLGEVDLTGYSQIAELVLDAEGERLLIFADGAVQRLRLQSGTWNESGTVFTPTCTVLSSAVLTPGDGVMVQTVIPEGMPNLRLTYWSGGQETVRYLSQSGETGEIILING